MTATWRVECRTRGYREPWQMYVERLVREVALETAEVLQPLHPTWVLRLHDTATGQVIHLDHEGRPKRPAVEVASAAGDVRDCPECQAGKHPNCHGDSWDAVTDQPAACPCWERGHDEPLMVPDRRTHAEVMADLAADRYEASLERGSDL